MTDLFQIKKSRKLAATGEAADISYAPALEEKLRGSEDGFSLVEAVIALIILLIVVSGVFATFAYAVNYNAGNNSRSQALAILQQEAELMRSAKFTPTTTDNIDSAANGTRDITGGTKAARVVTTANGYSYKVQTTVDDDPFTAGVQVDGTKTIKEITITVTLNSPTPGWQTAVPATVVLRRVQAN